MLKLLTQLLSGTVYFEQMKSSSETVMSVNIKSYFISLSLRVIEAPGGPGERLKQQTLENLDTKLHPKVSSSIVSHVSTFEIGR